MAVSVVPALLDALVSAADGAEDLTNVSVYDGFGVSDEPGDYLMIGVDDPDEPLAANSADTTQEWAYAGATERWEEGNIACAALSWTGDTNGQKTARDKAYAIAEALIQVARGNVSMSLPNVQWTGCTAAQLQQSQDESGALALLVFRIEFKALI